ncbi:hypothetical protein RIF29_05947 [Crotalaria pallida]|uniref:Syntaxin 6/10/61 N-terminal domain-containing protein n=1 Tax=Crotalaria pallida TaxID=3830 RepID=A0AAN9J444_CROPI
MASSFDRWEKDPFFNAAEEVQESADRLESAYRTWIHASKDSSSMWNSDEFHRDLHAALGTAKWQLEEFKRAVGSSYSKSLREGESPRNRHQDFIDAIEDKVTNVDHLLSESNRSAGKASLPWVHLDEGEQNELALFLSGMPAAESNNPTTCNSMVSENPRLSDQDSASDSRNFHVSSGWGEATEEMSHGHRRAASASPDISSWKIAVSDDALHSSSSGGSYGPMPKIPSLSGFLSSIEPVKLKWPRNGYRKLKAVDHHKETDSALLPTVELNRGTNACNERSKSYLDGCDECYDKQLHGWYGAIQRQLQRSQYQLQYSQPVRTTVWIVFLLCLIGKPVFSSYALVYCSVPSLKDNLILHW